MWVVKLGGSLNLDPHLPAWLRTIADLGGGRVAVVPGGGKNADAVREMQSHWGYGDVAAHNQAVLAMAQSALMFNALEPRLVLGAQDAELRAALHAGQSALWLPLNLVRQQADDLTSWDVTSDSLALWLARRMNAERLVVVKCCAVEAGSSLQALSSTGVLDARFPAWAEGAPFPIDIVQRDDLPALRQVLLSGGALARPPGGRRARRPGDAAAARDRPRPAPQR